LIAMVTGVQTCALPISPDEGDFLLKYTFESELHLKPSES
jgi:hypothetical protein